jgi:hypothetical protein
MQKETSSAKGLLTIKDAGASRSLTAQSSAGSDTTFFFFFLVLAVFGSFVFFLFLCVVLLSPHLVRCNGVTPL